MSSVRIENSLIESSVVDLFDTIDNVGNSNDDNDKIIDRIRNKVVILFCTHFRKKKEKKETILRQYKEYLKCFYQLIEKQMITIDNLIDEDIDDGADVFIKLKKELLDYSMQMYKLDLLDMSAILNKKEQSIYQFIHLYDLLGRYHRVSETMDLPQIKQNAQIIIKDKKSVLPNWKTYYYLVVCLEKQKEYNQSFVSYYRANNRKESENELILKLSNYYVADFQGQFSKSIYCRRKKLKLTQKQLQERSGVNHTMIAKIEKVKQPTTLETAIKLLSSLNMGIALYPFAEVEEKL